MTDMSKVKTMCPNRNVYIKNVQENCLIASRWISQAGSVQYMWYEEKKKQTSKYAKTVNRILIGMKLMKEQQ